MLSLPVRSPELLIAALGVAVALASQGASAEESFRPTPGIRVNSIGYLPQHVKRASVAGAATSVRHFALVSQASGKVVHSAPLAAPKPHADSGEELRTADFSDFRRPGAYALRVEGLPDSPPFRIAADVFNPSLRLVMLGFYGQRCGQSVSLEHQGARFEHGACHLKDGYLDYYDPAKAGEIRDGTGGWHDAGDYGKYMVNGAFSTGIMLTAWEHNGDKLASLGLPIPEKGGPLPDFLAEVKFNLDWLLKLQFEDGRVAHKLTRTHFEPMTLPTEDQEKRFFSPWGTAATANLAAVAAQAARVFAPYDAAYAERCRTAAEAAMRANGQTWEEIRPDLSAFHTGAYMRSAQSDRVWALAEVWETTGDPKTRHALEQQLGGDNFAVDVDWDWGDGQNLGVYTYLLSKRDRDPVLVAKLRGDLLAAADRIVANHDSNGYGRGLRSYYWGCNGSVARTVLNLAVAHRLTNDARYTDVAIDQLAYLYGRNPYGRSFVTGEGHNPPKAPHHRPSVGDSIEAPWPGHLVGGGHPGELDWHDVWQDARTNENAINWDASLAYALATVYAPAK